MLNRERSPATTRLESTTGSYIMSYRNAANQYMVIIYIYKIARMVNHYDWKCVIDGYVSQSSCFDGIMVMIQ